MSICERRSLPLKRLFSGNYYKRNVLRYIHKLFSWLSAASSLKGDFPVVFVSISPALLLFISQALGNVNKTGTRKGILLSTASTMDCTTNISPYVHRMEESEPLRKYFNSTEDYLVFLYGPKHSHLSLPMTWIYALIFIVGVSGNLLVCLVILKHRNMKTPTNCYLFSLAISDLLVLVFGMPLEVYEMWNNYPFLFGLVGCYFKTAFFETVCFASILIITMVSIERYMAVVHPFQARLKNTQQRALRIIFILWLLSVLFSIPNTSVHGIELQYFPNHTEIPGSAICAVVKSMWIYNWIIQLTSLLFYVLPMSVISVLYCLMALKLRRDRSLEVKDMRMNIKPSSRKSITKMMFILVIVFGVCWAPFHTDRLFYSFVATWTEPLANIFNLIHVVSGVFFYLSSAVNPIIYHVLSQHFRKAFLSVIFPQYKYWHSNIPQTTPHPSKVFSYWATKQDMLKSGVTEVCINIPSEFSPV